MCTNTFFLFLFCFLGVITIWCMEIPSEETATYDKLLVHVHALQKESFQLRGQLLGHALKFSDVPHELVFPADENVGPFKVKHPPLPALALMLAQTQKKLEYVRRLQESITDKYAEFEQTRAMSEIQRLSHELEYLNTRVQREYDKRAPYLQLANLSVCCCANPEAIAIRSTSSSEVPEKPRTVLKFNPFKE